MLQICNSYATLTFMRTIGERIKERRKKLGISLEQLAECIGKDRATVYRYETEHIKDMPISVIEPLARALNTTPSYLLGWEFNNNNTNTNSNNATGGANLNNFNFGDFGMSDNLSSHKKKDVPEFKDLWRAVHDIMNEPNPRKKHSMQLQLDEIMKMYENIATGKTKKGRSK